MYDPMINFIDEEFTRNPKNLDYDQFDVYIFAAAFKLEAVVYSLALDVPCIYYEDGRQFCNKMGTGLLTTDLNGICSNIVPSGNDVFTVVNYRTDDGYEEEDVRIRSSPLDHC
jgi:hypothetical protein